MHLMFRRPLQLLDVLSIAPFPNSSNYFPYPLPLFNVFFFQEGPNHFKNLTAALGQLLSYA